MADGLAGKGMADSKRLPRQNCHQTYASKEQNHAARLIADEKSQEAALRSNSLAHVDHPQQVRMHSTSDREESMAPRR